MDNIPDLGKDLSKVTNGRGEEIVKRFGRPGLGEIGGYSPRCYS